MKIFRIRLKSIVVRELASIGAYLDDHASPETATRVVDEIIAKIDSLRQYPERLPFAKEQYKRKPLRVLLVHNYRVLFHTSRSVVTVVAIVHAAKRRD